MSRMYNICYDTKYHLSTQNITFRHKMSLFDTKYHSKKYKCKSVVMMSWHKMSQQKRKLTQNVTFDYNKDCLEYYMINVSGIAQ